MQRILVVAAIMSVVCGSTPAWALPRFDPGEVLHASDLNDIVNAILGSAPQTINVNCPTQTIGEALQQATPGDIIQVTGTCNENVRILKDGITLNGQGQTIVDGGGPTQSAITVNGAQRVTIQGLTAQNGERGILILRGAAAILVDVTATGNAMQGILVGTNATATFRGTIVSNANGDNGIHMLSGGSASFDGATVQLIGNGDAGLSYSINAHGLMRNNSAFDIRDNRSDGMRATIGSAVFVENTAITLSRNGDSGIVIANTSTLFLRNSTMTVTGADTSKDGIGVFNSSSFFIEDAPAPITVSGNGDRGVEVANTSTLFIRNSRLDTTGNTGDGVGIFDSSRLSITLGSTVFSENNTVGVNVSDASSIGGSSGNTLTVQNNRSAGLQLTRASSAFLGGTTTVTNNGTQVVSSGIRLNGTCSASLSGTTLVQGNSDFGIAVIRASSLIASGTLNVLSNGDSGVHVDQEAALRLVDGTMVIDGNTNRGIGVFGNSQARLARSVGTLDLQIRNNVGPGILVAGNSSVALETGTVIRNNTADGVQARQSSVVVASNISVTGNGGNGLDVDESSADVSSSTLTGNTSTDVTATFGARLTLNNSTIGTIFCDSTVLRRVNGTLVACP